MKNKTLIILLIVLLSIVSVSLIVFMTSMINGKIGFFNIRNSYQVSNHVLMDETYDKTFELINVSADSGDIHIKHSEDSKIKVIIYGEEDETELNTNNNQLNVTLKAKKCIGFCFNRTLAKIEIYLPSDYAKTIQIKNNYGDINVASFNEATIDIEEDCGDVFVQEGKQVAIKNSYGDIELKSAVEANIIESAGDIEIGNVNKVTVTNDYGDIKIGSVLEYLNIEEDCGDVEIDHVTLTENSIIKNNLGDIKVGSTNEIFIDAKIDLGEIEIKNNYREANVVLTIENDCGDITVNN